MDRRESFKMIALAPLMAGFTWTGRDVERAREQTAAARAAGDFEPQFFTAHEYETVRILVDLILPADERSGSATELGVPEFMDFMMTDRPDMQTPMRGGLAWLDAHTHRRFGHPFAEATEDERRQILDEIAYPEEAAPEVAHGVAFFNRFRNLTASGFWTTKEGMEDLQYMGNRFVTKWEGAPEAEVKRLGLSFPDWAAE
ncbi:gluconate 2-dehydrogenase subunit 3 family protein [Rhodocaloribacter sp.]